MQAADSEYPRGSDAVGRTAIAEGGVTPAIANMLGATLRPGWHADALAEGDTLPLLWHWAAFPPDTPMEGIGPDGHPALGAFLPDLGLGRRMWAGGSLAFLHPLHIGERLTRRSEIVGVDWKQAGTGPLAIVSLAHVIEGESGPAIEETQQVVYLAIPDAYRPPKAIPAPADAAFDEAAEIDGVRLFRYSAATFNAHRIHYDRAYACEVEHYPGLIVHGPLQATLLLERAVRHRGGALPVRLTHRGVHPMFADRPMRLIGVDEGPGMKLCTATRGGDGGGDGGGGGAGAEAGAGDGTGGHQGMQVRAEWA